MSTSRSMRLRECEVVYRTRNLDIAVRHIVSSEDVYRLLGAMNATRKVTESLWVLLLDTRNKVLAVHECARGDVAGVSIRPQEVFRAALLVGANAIILAHNHPSGECAPSTEDGAFTHRVREAGQLLGIPVLDHVIVASSGYFSFLDAGLLRRLEDNC